MSPRERNVVRSIAQERQAKEEAQSLHRAHQEIARSLGGLMDEGLLKVGQEIRAQVGNDDQPGEVYKIVEFKIRWGVVVLERQRDKKRIDVGVHSEAIQNIVKAVLSSTHGPSLKK